MGGSVFIETLRQSWRQMLYWGVAFGLIMLMMVLIIPGMEGAMQSMLDLLRNLPPFMVSMIGVDPNNIEWIASPEGFIAVGFFGKMLLFMAAYPVVMGMRVTANEEDDGSLDMLLSLPVPRWRVVLEKFAAYALTLVVVSALMYVGLWVGEQMVQLGLNMGRMGEAIFNMIPAMLFILAFTTLIGAMLRRKRIILGVATAFVLVSFMLTTIGQMGAGSIAEHVQWVSFFTYNDSTGVVETGLVWTNILILTVVALGMLGGALWAFDRRDVGV
ncbi:MAG: ABC transporter permease subunit [Anaerolineae bacterium]|nr:ABC transporter permease subunit [Anaerolineae bacterium]